MLGGRPTNLVARSTQPGASEARKTASQSFVVGRDQGPKLCSRLSQVETVQRETSDVGSATAARDEDLDGRRDDLVGYPRRPTVIHPPDSQATSFRSVTGIEKGNHSTNAHKSRPHSCFFSPASVAPTRRLGAPTTAWPSRFSHDLRNCSIVSRPCRAAGSGMASQPPPIGKCAHSALRRSDAGDPQSGGRPNHPVSQLQ